MVYKDTAVFNANGFIIDWKTNRSRGATFDDVNTVRDTATRQSQESEPRESRASESEKSEEFSTTVGDDNDITDIFYDVIESSSDSSSEDDLFEDAREDSFKPASDIDDGIRLRSGRLVFRFMNEYKRVRTRRR